MPRYHFTITDGVELEDPEGSELPNLAAAACEAQELARELLADGIRTGLDRRKWSIKIVDEQGNVLRVVPFTEAVRREDHIHLETSAERGS